MPKPTTVDAIFDEADMDRVTAAKPRLVQEDALLYFPAGAWGDLLDRAGLPDLAARARRELAPTAGPGRSAAQLMGPEHGRRRKSDRVIIQDSEIDYAGTSRNAVLSAFKAAEAHFAQTESARPEPHSDDTDTYIGFLFPRPTRSVEEIAATVAGDLRRLFVGAPASGQWRLLWAPCQAGLELLVMLDSTLFDDHTHQHLTDIVLSGQDTANVMTSHEVNDLLDRLEAAIATGDARLL